MRIGSEGVDFLLRKRLGVGAVSTQSENFDEKAMRHAPFLHEVRSGEGVFREW